MEFFKDVHSVRLLGHKGKYLWADDDRRSVAQKKGQDSYGIIWRVELVPGRHAIRLKNVYDLYLVASDYPFLFGATGKKVMQGFDSRGENVEWEPIREGAFVKFRTKGDKFLRANGGMPPYRNSVTHDVPVLASNQHVVLWEVDIVRRKEPVAPSPKQNPVVVPTSPPPRWTQESDSSHDLDSAEPEPFYTRHPPRSRRHSAPEDIEFPPPSPSESASPASERLSLVPSPPRRRRQLSPSPSVDSSLRQAGVRRGHVPVLPKPKDEDDVSSDVEYSQSALSSQRGSLQQSRHQPTVSDIPPRFATQRDEDDDDDNDFVPSPRTPKIANISLLDTTSPRMSPKAKPPSDFRRIFYTVAEGNGEVLAHDDNTFGSFLFKGFSVQDLTEALQVETGIDEDVVLCMRNPLTSKLYKMRLQLPPNKSPLSIVIVRRNSEFGRTLSIRGTRERS